jgi:hypothetical protein
LDRQEDSVNLAQDDDCGVEPAGILPGLSSCDSVIAQKNWPTSKFVEDKVQGIGGVVKAKSALGSHFYGGIGEVVGGFNDEKK